MGELKLILIGPQWTGLSFNIQGTVLKYYIWMALSKPNPRQHYLVITFMDIHYVAKFPLMIYIWKRPHLVASLKAPRVSSS